MSNLSIKYLEKSTSYNIISEDTSSCGHLTKTLLINKYIKESGKIKYNLSDAGSITNIHIEGRGNINGEKGFFTRASSGWGLGSREKEATVNIELFEGDQVIFRISNGDAIRINHKLQVAMCGEPPQHYIDDNYNVTVGTNGDGIRLESPSINEGISLVTDVYTVEHPRN